MSIARLALVAAFAIACDPAGPIEPAYDDVYVGDEGQTADPGDDNPGDDNPGDDNPGDDNSGGDAGGTGPEDYRLVVEPDAQSTRWWYGRSVFTRLCASIEEDGAERVLRVYPASMSREYAPYCAESGHYDHALLSFQGHYIATQGAGWVTIDDSSTGEIIEGDTRFDDDQTAELIVEVTDPTDDTIAPALLALTIQTTPSELLVRFAKVD